MPVTRKLCYARDDATNCGWKNEEGNEGEKWNGRREVREKDEEESLSASCDIETVSSQSGDACKARRTC
jgi:hypothetical protein